MGCVICLEPGPLQGHLQPMPLITDSTPSLPLALLSPPPLPYPCPLPEMYMQHPKKERIKLKERKGFVRIAVEEGLDGGIIPVSGAWQCTMHCRPGVQQCCATSQLQPTVYPTAAAACATVDHSQQYMVLPGTGCPPPPALHWEPVSLPLTHSPHSLSHSLTPPGVPLWQHRPV